MTEIEREYLVLSLAYLQDYKEDYGLNSDEEELYKFMQKEVYAVSKKVMNIAVEISARVAKKLDELYKGKNIIPNLLGLSINLCMLLLEYNVFKGSKGLKLKRLSWSIYTKLEASQRGNDEFRNSCRIISNLDDYNEEN